MLVSRSTFLVLEVMHASIGGLCFLEDIFLPPSLVASPVGIFSERVGGRVYARLLDCVYEQHRGMEAQKAAQKQDRFGRVKFMQNATQERRTADG